MPITLRDIVKMLNDSFRNDSRSSNGHPGINEEKNRHVNKLAKTSGNNPDPVTLNLMNNRSKNTAAFESDIEYGFFASAVKDIVHLYFITVLPAAAEYRKLTYIIMPTAAL